jgi:Acyltransferase family
MSCSLNQSIQNRDVRCDILKAIGLLFIIVAHTIRGSWFFELTNFNVPVMVIASGMLFAFSSGSVNISWWQYLRKRVPRLILPVWCFLVFFFSLEYLIRAYEGKPYPFSGSAIFQSFLLIDSPGIEFVWIIRVFFLVAIVSPGLLKLKNRCVGTNYFPIAILGVYTLYEFWLTNLSGAIKKWLAISTNSELVSVILQTLSEFSREILVGKGLFYLIPYSCLFALGMILTGMKSRTVFIFALISLFIFLGLTAEFSGTMTPLQSYKYPPRLYYISYGIAVFLILYFGVTQVYRRFPQSFSENNLIVSWIVFFSSSTLWIYLWHSVILSNLHLLYKLFLLPKTIFLFPSNFVLTIGLSIAITYTQKQLGTCAIAKTRWGQRHAKLLTTLFLR